MKTKQKTLDDERLITPDEFAAYLHVPKSYIYRLTHEKRIGFIKVGKYVRFRESEVLTWLKGQGLEPDSEVR